jgi:N-acetylglucosaminyldiphosphoundecaprenol N-acetyl-beta-D-mannosaminyltransferase
MVRRTVPVLDGQFDALTQEEVVEWASEWIRSGRRGWICTVNVAVLMAMRADARLAAFVDRAALVVADGQPIVWLSRRGGRPLPERVAGVDLIEALAARAARDGVPIYLLGARSAVVRRAAAQLTARHPGLVVAGVADGYFGPEDAPARAEAVAASGARLLLVGMGVPRQERFLEAHWDALGVSLAIGVGGSFEVVAGVRRRAPRWCQRAGLEWLCRLLQEPRRLGGRYLVTNTQFVCRAAGDLVRTRAGVARRAWQ